jgi:tripartite-type tricarboxylate transporter receptor subunit TctC
MPPERTKFLRDAIWKTFNDPEFIAWSKKAKRPVEAVSGEETEKNLRKVMADYEAYEDLLKKYIK